MTCRMRYSYAQETAYFTPYQISISYKIPTMYRQELLDLGDKIGYVGTGLQEEEISTCVRKFKNSNHHRDWKCSICQVKSLSSFLSHLLSKGIKILKKVLMIMLGFMQERCGMGEEIGILECGHHHHIECIKQWLLKRNACPVCKSAAK